MASADDSKLHWCTEEIPIGSKYFLEFGQPFTEPLFLGSLQREGSWIGSLPKISTGSFDISRLQYLVPTLRSHQITTSEPNKIKQELIKFSQYLLEPHHAFIHLFSNFDFCQETEYIPLSSHNQYITSLPLFTGKIINKNLINTISVLIKNDKLDSLKICEDIARTGIGLRCLYPKQYNSVQSRFIIRATVDFKYPGKYILNNDAFDILIMDKEWTDYVNKIQTEIIDKNLIPTQQEKLWKPLFVDPITSHSSSDDSEDDQYYKLKRVSDQTKNKNTKKRISPFIIYDFCQNRYSSIDENLDDIISSISYSSREALKCANMQREFNQKISRCHVYMVLSMNDNDSKPTAYVYRLNILETYDINLFIKQLNEKKINDDNKSNDIDIDIDDELLSITSVASLIIYIIKHNIDEFHKEVLLSIYCNASNFIEITDKILKFLKVKQDKTKKDNILLLQERAIIVLADVIWLFYKRFNKEFIEWLASKDIDNIIREYVSSKDENINELCEQIEYLKNTIPSKFDDDNDLAQYYGFLEPFLKASNEKELQDFNECAQELLQQHSNISLITDIRYNDINEIYQTESGMRVGISSANASDNWTNSKLNGGVTINMSINLDSIKATPVMAKVHIIPNNVIIRLSTTHTMHGDVKEDKIEFTADNISDFLKIDDNMDVFRMLKYALIFVGIVKDPHLDHLETNNYSSILSDISLFTGGHGLSVSVINLGPSRSGFASSSAVACNLLKVLYCCYGNNIGNNDQLLGSMALLLENRLGLKSGRQDVDGLLPNGVKILHYNKTTKFVTPKISYLSTDKFNVNQLGQKMILVNSGIARAPGLGLHRGLNMRFLAFLSRDPVRFKSILQSYKIHDDIIKALQCNNYCFLGKLFLDYMSCRERIDPGATQSKYDKDHNNKKILRKLFDPLVNENLIYGGMFTGAMGGGVAMLSLTQFAMEINKNDKYKRTNIQYRLDELKKWKTNNGSIPFKRLSKIEYSVNVNGILLTKKQLNDNNNNNNNTMTKLLKKEYLFKSMNNKNIICFDDDFEEITFSMDGLTQNEIKKIKNITDKGMNEKKDINIVVIETYTKNDKVTCKVSHAKTT